MNDFDLQTGREFIPFDTYSFGILEAGSESPGVQDSVPPHGNRPMGLPISARLLPDILETDLSEALRSGVSDQDLKTLLTLTHHAPAAPRIQEIQLQNLSPLNSDDAYSFDPIPTDAPPTPTQATVDIQKSGDRVEKISIHCSCGEVIHLDCVY